MSAMQNTAVVQPNRRKSLKQWLRSMRGQQILVTLVFLFVPLLLLVTFTYLPFFKMVQFSFFSMRYIGRRTFVGLQNYIDVFIRDDIFHALTLSLYYMAGSVIQMALALLFATLLSRPSDSGHTPFGDIFLSQSPDMEFWGRHRHVMGKSGNWWENLKIGGGAAPIETSEGWLLFYHGVTGTCNGYVYSIGGAILDRDEPSRVLHRCSTFLLTPETDYEERGFVPNVCFPCATLQDAATGRIALYYGCADSYVGLAFTTADEVVDYIKAHDQTSDADRELGLR